MPVDHTRRIRSVSRILQDMPAVESLLDRAQTSRRCLSAVLRNLPKDMRADLQFGRLEQGKWTLIVDNTSVAAKLRQLKPQLLYILQQENLPVQQINIKTLPR